MVPSGQPPGRGWGVGEGSEELGRQQPSGSSLGRGCRATPARGNPPGLGQTWESSSKQDLDAERERAVGAQPAHASCTAGAGLQRSWHVAGTVPGAVLVLLAHASHLRHLGLSPRVYVGAHAHTRWPAPPPAL